MKISEMFSMAALMPKAASPKGMEQSYFGGPRAHGGASATGQGYPDLRNKRMVRKAAPVPSGAMGSSPLANPAEAAPIPMPPPSPAAAAPPMTPPPPAAAPPMAPPAPAAATPPPEPGFTPNPIPDLGQAPAYSPKTNIGSQSMRGGPLPQVEDRVPPPVMRASPEGAGGSGAGPTFMTDPLYSPAAMNAIQGKL